MDTMWNTVTGQYFNTVNTISAECGRDILESTLVLCECFEGLLSKTREGSDVWRLNHAQGEWVLISAHTQRILSMALTMYETTNGAFNIAMGKAVNLWHFNDKKQRVPGREELRRALAGADCGRIEQKGDSARLPAGMEIDLGGIAKGYIADEIGAYLRECGVRRAVINLGGNILTIGSKADGTPWQIGLQYPVGDRAKREKYWGLLHSRDNSIVTSGCYERGFWRDGTWYHHILDPRSGMPVQNRVLSVTVRTKDSFLADAVTTPLLILGEREGMELAERYGVEVVYYLKNNEIVYTRGTELMLVREG